MFSTEYTTIKAPDNGRTVYTVPMIYHGTDDQGNTYATLYAHMNSTPPVSVGQSVSQGDVIGYVGTTGNSTGNHLHLELRVNGARTNPLNYVPH